MTSPPFIDDNAGLGRPKQRLMIAILLNELAGGAALPSEGDAGGMQREKTHTHTEKTQRDLQSSSILPPVLPCRHQSRHVGAT